MLLSNKETTHEKSGIDTLMCFPARGSFFDLHFNQEQDSPRVPRPISGASPSKKQRRHTVGRRYAEGWWCLTRNSPLNQPFIVIPAKAGTQGPKRTSGCAGPPLP